MKYSVATILLAGAIVSGAPTNGLQKRNFQSIVCHSGTGSNSIAVNTVVTNGLFTPLNLGSTIVGLATQCNNQILANLGGLSSGYTGQGTTVSYGNTNANTGSSSPWNGQGTTVSYGNNNAGSSNQWTGQGTTVSYGNNANTGSSSPWTGQGTTVSYGNNANTGSSNQWTGQGTTVSYGNNNANTGSSNQYTGQGTTVSYGSGSGSSGGSSSYSSPTYQRQQFTQNLVAHMRQQYPNYSVVACLPGQYSFSGTPVQKQTVQCSTSSGTVNYDVVVYNKGTCNFHSPSGFENYAFVPNPTCQYSGSQCAC